MHDQLWCLISEQLDKIMKSETISGLAEMVLPIFETLKTCNIRMPNTLRWWLTNIHTKALHTVLPSPALINMVGSPTCYPYAQHIQKTSTKTTKPVDMSTSSMSFKNLLRIMETSICPWYPVVDHHVVLPCFFCSNHGRRFWIKHFFCSPTAPPQNIKLISFLHVCACHHFEVPHDHMYVYIYIDIYIYIYSRMLVWSMSCWSNPHLLCYLNPHFLLLT